MIYEQRDYYKSLAAIVMVVVLIFTTGTLGAAGATSSFAPQPQNLTCTHPDNNASCSQEGIISTTQISLATITTTIISYIDKYKTCNK